MPSFSDAARTVSDGVQVATMLACPLTAIVVGLLAGITLANTSLLALGGLFTTVQHGRVVVTTNS